MGSWFRTGSGAEARLGVRVTGKATVLLSMRRPFVKKKKKKKKKIENIFFCFLIEGIKKTLKKLRGFIGETGCNRVRLGDEYLVL